MFGMVVKFLILALLGLLLLMPSVVGAQSGYAGAEPPSIGQPLLREGDFAVKLAQALSLGTSRDEVEAENQLAAAGITPKNGWIADYPVTPDIVDEIRQSVRSAASSGKIKLSVAAANERLDDVLAQAGLSVQAQGGGAQGSGAQGSGAVAEKTYTAESAQPPAYQDPTVINNYYVTEGPPAVTYYAPPPAYSYLYSWVPYPFWSVGFWFPGFFILHDFHRAVFIDNRVVVVSNHFRDFRHHRSVRIDPVARIRGHNIAGTRVIHNRDLRGIVDARGTRVINGTRGVITDRSFNRERAIVGEPRGQTVRNINRGGSSDGRGVALSNRGRGSVSFREPGVMTPSGITARRNATGISRGDTDFSRGATGVSRGAMGFDRGINLRSSGSSGRGAVFEGGSGGSRGSQFRNVRSFSTVRSGGASFIPSASMSRGGGTSFRGGATMSMPRQGGSAGSFSRGSSFGTMGGRGRR
jgi:hypothetical protein